MASTISDEKCAKERVVDAARQLFSCRGFHQTAMADLAGEAHRNDCIARAIEPWGVAYRGVLRALAHFINPGLTAQELDGAEEMLLATIFGVSYRRFSGATLEPQCVARLLARFMVRALSAPTPPVSD